MEFYKIVYPVILIRILGYYASRIVVSFVQLVGT